MKPSKKAKELFFKFKNIDSDSQMFDNFKMKDFYAQRCLLIAVEEIISELKIRNGCTKYWQEVKKEIGNL
jgi:hypothetical protein